MSDNVVYGFIIRPLDAIVHLAKPGDFPMGLAGIE